MSVGLIFRKFSCCIANSNLQVKVELRHYAELNISDFSVFKVINAIVQWLKGANVDCNWLSDNLCYFCLLFEYLCIFSNNVCWFLGIMKCTIVCM